MVRGTSQRSKIGRGPSLWYGSGRGTFPEAWKLSGDPYRGPELVGGPSWRPGSGRGTFPKVSKVVGGPIRRSGSGRGTLPEVRKWSEDPPGGPDVV